MIELRVGADERDYVLSELQALFQRIERNRTITDEVRSFSDAHRLSPTMTALLELAAAGLDNHQAAAELGVTLGTVSTLWRRIRKRTGCPSQREVFASMLRRALGEQTEQPVMRSHHGDADDESSDDAI